jgi:hypothetical protein
MADDLAAVVSLIGPLFIGFVCHGCCMKFNLLPALAVPVDGGRKFRCRRLLGANKTFRGFLGVGFGTAFGFMLRAWLGAPGHTGAEPLWLRQPSVGTFCFGLFVGVAAMLAELPNSFVKRQLNISPGEQGNKWVGAAFFVIDQVDMLLGVWLALACAVTISWSFMAWSAAFLFGAHQVITLVGYMLGMRATWR